MCFGQVKKNLMLIYLKNFALNRLKLKSRLNLDFLLYLILLFASPKSVSGKVWRVRSCVSNLKPLTLMTTLSQRLWSWSKGSKRIGKRRDFEGPKPDLVGLALLANGSSVSWEGLGKDLNKSKIMIITISIMKKMNII